MAGRQPMTAEQLRQMPDDGFRYELVRGELIQMAPPGGEHGWLVINIGAILANHVRPRDLGYVLGGDPGIRLQRDPDTVRGPDLAFYAKGRLPGGPPAGYIEVVPDLIVEIMSPDDRWTEVEEKVEEYLRAGTGLVWVVNPPTKTVTQFTSPEQTRRFTSDDTLDGGDVLPGFSCPVADLFA